VSELEPVYLLIGSDRPKIARALERLRARVGEEAVQQLSARDASGEDVVAACNAPGLFGAGHRLVLVEEAERWKAADVKALAAYLDAPAPEAVVALSADLKRDAPLAKACAKHGDVLHYDVPRRQLPAWVGEQFARLGSRAEPAACAALVELVGDDLEELANEVDKLVTWAAGEQVEALHVQALAAGRAETSIFALTDAWGRRDLAGVLAACEELLERAHRNRRDEVPRLAAMLAGHVGRVRACQSLAAAGVRPRDAAGTLKMHPFVTEKAFAQAGNYTVDELRDAIVRLADLDLALKGGSRLAPDLELQRALVEMTAPAA
jgi:DNA polymerase III subunit delta